MNSYPRPDDEPGEPTDGQAVSGAGRKRRWTAWIPAVLVASALFALSSIPGQHLSLAGGAGMDKVAHALAYALLGLAIARALCAGGRLESGTAVVLGSLVLGALYGATDEAHQLLTPNRSFDLLDLAADALGSLLGGLAYVATGRSWAKGRRPDP